MSDDLKDIALMIVMLDTYLHHAQDKVPMLVRDMSRSSSGISIRSSTPEYHNQKIICPRAKARERAKARLSARASESERAKFSSIPSLYDHTSCRVMCGRQLDYIKRRSAELSIDEYELVKNRYLNYELSMRELTNKSSELMAMSRAVNKAIEIAKRCI